MFTARSRSFVRIVGAASAAIVLMTAGTRAQPYSSYQGSWIWQSAAGPVDTWMCFRKTFSLSSVPSSAVARIAADSKYWLWINGRQVVFDGGLKRGPTPSATWCDEVDVTGYLTTGANCIAVLVWFWGRTGTSYTTSGSGGLYFECPIGSTFVKSDESWKAIVHPAFVRTGANLDPLSEYPVKFNAANDIGDWFDPGSNDAQWTAAVSKGVPPAQPWGQLWKSPAPLWKNSGLVDYVNASKLPSTSTGGAITATLPSNIQVTPYLKINAAAGLTVTMKTDHDNGLYGHYITKAGVQEWEDPAWMNGENVIYSIPSGVQILALKYRETGYNTDLSGSFSCNDTFFNSLWTKALRTAYVCMRDSYMDCPDRERAPWVGDNVNEFGATFYGMDPKAHGLTAKLYNTLVGWQGADGSLGVVGGDIPAQALLALSEVGIWNYYLNSADIATIRAFYPAAKKYLGLYSLGADGLEVNRSGSDPWYDWGDGCADGKVLENALYYSCLKSAISMAAVTGNSADIAGWQTRKSSIEANFNRVFVKGGSYLSSSCTTPDDRANALAVVAGLADSTNFAGIASVLASTRNCSPFIEGYVAEALCLMGRAAEAQARLKARYAQMVSSQYPSLWEDFSSGGTTNHGWNAVVVSAMSGYMAGIGPDSAGYSTYHVLPRMGGLTSIKASVATVKGRVAVSLGKKADGFAMALTSPAATAAIVGIPRTFDNGAAVTDIKCGNQTVWSSSGSAVTVAGVSFVKIAGSFVTFAVSPGSWRFTTGNAPAVDSLPTAAGVGREMPAVKSGKIIISGTVLRIAAPSGSHVVVCGMDGRIVGRALVNRAKSSAQLRPLGAGMYVYHVFDGSQRCSGRFVLR